MLDVPNLPIAPAPSLAASILIFAKKLKFLVLRAGVGIETYEMLVLSVQFCRTDTPAVSTSLVRAPEGNATYDTGLPNMSD